MKLLIITQKVDMHDSVLGFMHGWINEFARQTELVTVICLEAGAYQFPPNVEVFSLGKEKRKSRLLYLWRFYSYIWSKRDRYDSVFVHMNQIYVILGGLLWRSMGKRITLWYAHGKVSLSLRCALACAHMIFTSTPSGFRIRSHKTHVVGQGIDVATFSWKDRVYGEPLVLITVGRISPIKDYETLIKAVEILTQEGRRVKTIVVGGAGKSDQEGYFTKIKNQIKESGLETDFECVGAIPHREILKYLHEAHLFINTSRTGSLDKAGLEGMSTGLPVITSNEAYMAVLAHKDKQLMFPAGDAQDLARKIKWFMDLKDEERQALSRWSREVIERHHSLPRLVARIIDIINTHA